MSTPLVVTGGLYNFYAVSTKNDALPPTFSDTEATALQNGVDYLWCGVEGQTINSNGTTIPLTFTHSATQVVVVVVHKDHIYPMLCLNYALCEIPQLSSSVSWLLQTCEMQSATALSVQYVTIHFP